jgi:fused signal recognition particle receptor
MTTDSIWGRLRKGLARTREVLDTPVEDLVRGRRPLDAADLESVEEALIAADMGLPAVEQAMQVLREKSGQIAGRGAGAMRAVLQEEARRALERPALAAPFAARPWVVFVVGVNGVGKTTTIGKLARLWRDEGRSSLLCAADTFRAAAAEQLELWASRVGAPFHRGAEGADPSAVLTDGLRAARSRGLDAVLVDTAGRLHTKGNLMAELAKMARVAAREMPGAPHETLLVLDATVGSNGLAQAREFARAAGVTGLVLTKLDGTAKGGVAVAVVRELDVPIRYVGVGEAAEDLLPFDAAAFAEGLFGA